MSVERPEWDASFASWQRYCDELNKVALTVEKMELGFGCLTREQKFPDQIVRYAQTFSGLPAELVIAAIRARYDIWSEAWECGMDLKEQQPEVYSQLATRPLTPEDFNVFPTFSEAEA